jgi:hypothetical protein
MSDQIHEKKSGSSIIKYKTVLILAILPVILALYTNSVNMAGVIQTLSSGVFPVAFTTLSWGIAIQQLIQIKKK